MGPQVFVAKVTYNISPHCCRCKVKTSSKWRLDCAIRSADGCSADGCLIVLIKADHSLKPSCRGTPACIAFLPFCLSRRSILPLWNAARGPSEGQDWAGEALLSGQEVWKLPVFLWWETPSRRDVRARRDWEVPAYLLVARAGISASVLTVRSRFT